MKWLFGFTVCLSLAVSVAFTSGCGKRHPAERSEMEKGGGPGAPTGAPPAPVAGHGGPVIDLGTATIGSFTVRATRDEGMIVAGKDAPIDVTVVPAAGASSKASAVRFWIGTADAKGSVKAKAAIENPSDPNRWHTHAEVPNPLPEGSKLWVEIEPDQGEKAVGSFDLRR